MTATLVVKEGQIWQVANNGRSWIVRSVHPSNNLVLIENDQGYKTEYSATGLLIGDHWTLIEDPTDTNLSEFIAQKCSECGEVQSVVSREDIRNGRASISTMCSHCNVLPDPYEDDEYYEDDFEYDP